MSQRFDSHGYALDSITDTDDVRKRTPANVREVALKGSDPVVKVIVDDRTFDPAVHEELPAAPVAKA
jgi:hypothetical protein